MFSADERGKLLLGRPVAGTLAADYFKFWVKFGGFTLFRLAEGRETLERRPVHISKGGNA